MKSENTYNITGAMGAPDPWEATRSYPRYHSRVANDNIMKKKKTMTTRRCAEVNI
jgi:hypothetical protein